MNSVQCPTQEEFEANENLNSQNSTPCVSAVKKLEPDESSKKDEASKLTRLV